MERAGCIVCSPAFSWPSIQLCLPPYLASSSSLLPELRTVAGKETWLIRVRGLCASKGSVKWFRLGRSPPCLHLSRWHWILVLPCHVLPHTALLPKAAPELWAVCGTFLCAHPP